jgi:ribosomal protein S18 acetylase RimI-like enzyme
MTEPAIRGVRLPDDVEAVQRLDRSFVTGVVYDVEFATDGFRLVERRIEPPLRKVFPLEDLNGDTPWDTGFLAADRGEVAGFIATSIDEWNRRLVVWHFYVAPYVRRKGIGRRLLNRALEDGTNRGALVAWLETSNFNYPGIQAYRALGFELCGLDTTLYSGTSSEGEFALFLARRLIDPLARPRVFAQ